MTRLTASLFRTGFTATKVSSIRSVLAHQNGHLLTSGSSARPLHSSPTIRIKMRIVPVPVRDDNYSYLIIDEKTNSAAVVDPCEPKDIIKAAKAENVTLSGTILTTHHHEDHSGGNLELISFLQENDTSKDKVKVYGGSKKIPGLTNLVEHKSNFKLGLGEKAGENDGGGIEVSCLATPCHTGDSICYYLQDSRQGGPGCVFTGDTLFVAGCGRFFEGTPEEMDEALNKRLASLPDETITHVGHEYTKSNAAFAKSIEPKNQHLLGLIKACESKDLAGITTGKYTIGDEKKFNPFMRLEEPDVVSAVGLNSPSRVEVMAKLRELKNSFKA